MKTILALLVSVPGVTADSAIAENERLASAVKIAEAKANNWRRNGRFFFALATGETGTSETREGAERFGKVEIAKWSPSPLCIVGEVSI